MVPGRAGSDTRVDVQFPLSALREMPGAPAVPAQRARSLSPPEQETLLYGLARLAIDFVSGPGGVASALRRTLLGSQLNGKSVPLDAGYSDQIPAAIRHAVIQRDKHCAWSAGCDRPAAVSDVHHIKHKKTAAPPASKTACRSASTTRTSASTAGAGKSNSSPTEPPAPPDPKDRSSKATHHPRVAAVPAGVDGRRRSIDDRRTRRRPRLQVSC